MGAAAAPLMMAGVSLGSAYIQSQEEKMQGEYQRSVSSMNASILDAQANDAIARGDTAAAEALRAGNVSASNIKKDAKKVSGSQRAALSAQGIDVSSGSASDVLSETQSQAEQDFNRTKYFSKLDAITIKNNAWREAWGFKAESANTLFSGNMARSVGDLRSSNTLLTGGLKAFAYGVDAYGSKKSSTAGVNGKISRS